MKICGFLIIYCCLILAMGQCGAVNWACVYRNDFHFITQTSAYFCHLFSDNRNAVDVTSINGKHEIGKSDDDVKVLWMNSNLRTFSSIFCQKFKNLELIDIGNVEIKSIDENSLQKCKNLNFIILQQNKILKVPEKLLAENSKLIQVWITFNNLTTVPEFFLQNQNHLEKLFLQRNKINFLPSKFFEPLVNLQHLDISNNQLQVVDPEWFVGLKKLKVLYLGENKISEVPSGIFRPLRNLQTLWLGSNGIKSLSPGSFEGLENLADLNLDINEIVELPSKVFILLKNLKFLDLDSNKLAVIHANSFGSHSQLKIIYLQNNKIKEFDEKIIDNTAVEKLNMTNNLCSNESIESRNKIKGKLQKCIENYRLRTISQRQKIIPATESRITIMKSSQSNQSNSIQTLSQSQAESSPTVCGISMAGTGNIIGGTQISRNSYPWIAALVLRANGDFFCGGTLVTDQKIVTAAHCIKEKGASKPILKTYFYVLLGIHNLKVSIEPGRIAYVVDTINIHHDWDPVSEKFDADIAVLILEQTVVFTRHIQPICLIQPASNIASIIHGIVVGFGKSEDETKKHENIPKIIGTPIIDDRQCFVTDYRLARFSSIRTFCGGTGNGTGVCKGDSGSGLFVKFGGVYYLRGIVSSSLFRGNYDCDVDTYSIFTDMLKYYDWVNEI